MKKLLILLSLLFSLSAFTNKNEGNNLENPFFIEWSTPHQTPPFDLIKDEHYLPAFKEGIKQEKAEIEAIADNPEEPTFKNTIEAIEKSGALLNNVRAVFSNLNSAHTNPAMQETAKIITPLLAAHNDDIYLNEKLFTRIKKLYNNIDALNLDTEQHTLLDKYYKDFIRSGAGLNEQEKEELRKINEELSSLTLKFGENLLKETNAVALVIEDKKDLAGLPEDVINAASETAEAKGFSGKWAFTLQKPSFIPFLQYSTNRELRKILFDAYCLRGNNGNEFDNKELLSRIASLRVNKAKLLGYENHAQFVLEKNMAKTTDAVSSFLNDLWEPALKRAAMEIAEMEEIIRREGNSFKLEPHDWWYYSEKVKKSKYNLDEEQLRPYFEVTNVMKGVFTTASNLYGLKFIKRTDIPVYHPDVQVFEVTESDGRHVGIIYTDYYPRDSKRSGAWMSSFRPQTNMDGNFVTPVIYNVGNFSKPTADKPALLSLDEVNTLFHEFGHALHYLLANTKYRSSKSVPRDFVELPSQIMENWALHPDVLKYYAFHYKTGEVIPAELVEKIENSRQFNQGFETVEYLSAALLDMEWHTLTGSEPKDAVQFESEALKKMGAIPQIRPRYLSTNFQHIFSGGYSAGYYSYIWAEVLDADAFAAFSEKGIFNKELAASFRKLLESGGSEDPMVLYKRFRGREPEAEALLEKRGLK